jgi:hypothetical protein
VPHDSIVGRSVYEQIMVDDKACNDDQDAKTGQPVRQVEFKAVEADNAESRQENPKSETGADPGGKTGVVAGDHGEPAATGGTEGRVRFLEAVCMPIANGINIPLLWDVKMAERLTEEQVSQVRHEQLNVDKVPIVQDVSNFASS